MKKLIVMIVLLMSLLLVACGGDDSSTADTPEGRGEALYRKTAIGPNSAPGCITCHSLDEGVTLVGPSHAGMGTRAETAVDGMTAEEYLHDSIVNPDTHITEGFTAGVMYQSYESDLTAAQIDDLVAFLLSQK